MGTQNELKDGTVELGTGDGVTFIEQASPLTRLHYFDGKFLRADAFALEQDYHRSRTRLGNLAGGWGVVHGLGVGLSGNQLEVSAGLAITAAGNFVLATGDMQAALAELIGLATPAPIGGNPEFGDCIKDGDGFTESNGLHIYEITVGPIEGLCGNEAVYGKLCESACVSSSQHPYWREGVVLRLRPISLQLPSSALPLGNAHLRNRVASAYFAAEPWLSASALSAAGLASNLWCNPATLYGRDEVVIGLLVREGGVNRVLDAWSGRRERMDSQARGYWQGRMAMRPWNVFVAQVLQFQCQLAGLFDGTGGTLQPADDCDQLRQLLDKTRKEIEALHKRYDASAKKILKQFGDKPTKKDAQLIADQVQLSYADLFEISDALASAQLGKGALPKNRLLLNAGFVELPPAGYLPVIPGKQALETQLERMFGEGVHLHYHAVRHDEIAHLVEEAQHMERISLTRGIDDPKQIEEVEIFVPDGEPFSVKDSAPGTWWQVEMSFAALDALDFGFETSDDATKLADGAALKKDMVLEREAVAAAAAATPAGTSTSTNTAETTVGGNIAGTPMSARMMVSAVRTELPQKLRELLEEMARRPLRGLARTESREDGSHGFTLIATLDLADLLAELNKLLAAHPEAAQGQTLSKQIETLSGLSLYLAGDIARDPFDLAIGEDTAIKGEISLGRTTVGISGDLAVLFDRPTSSGAVERVVALKLIASSANGKLTSSGGTLSLIRKGDSDDGQFIIDDAQHDPASGPIVFEWEAQPRTAEMYVLAAAGKEAAATKYMRSLSGNFRTKDDGSASALAGPDPAPSSAPAASDPAASARTRLLKLDGLDGMPALDSTIGAAAMNALIKIADATDDHAFLARARRRLFPTLDTPQHEGVRAVLDWVMFRRARTHLCCPSVSTPAVKAALEVFQVWHLALGAEMNVEAVQKALDSNDQAVLAKLVFQRVGVLRFREQNIVSEETEAQVVAMWQHANPGNQVVLGRYWEEAPRTGQGWQNHARLRTMLTRIAALTQPPVRGDGAIARLAAVSPPLADGALDGGLLVVTATAASAIYTHRVLTADVEVFALLARMLKEKPEAAWEIVHSLAEKNQFKHDLSIAFSGATPAAAGIDSLKAADAAMRTAGGQYRVSAVRIDAATLLAGENPAAQHATLSTVVAVSDQVGNFTTSATDLGGGAHTLSMIGYAHLEATPLAFDHQVVFVDEKSFETLHRRLLSAGANDALGQLNLELQQGAHRATVVSFDNGSLRTPSIAALKSFDSTMRQVNQDYAIRALHIDAPTARAGENLSAQHGAITTEMGVSSGNLVGGFTASSFDTRGGFHAVTVLGYFPG